MKPALTRRRTVPRALGRAALAALLASGLASAAEFNLVAVTFPDGRSVDVPLARTNATPVAAKLRASVRFARGQARVEVSYRGMEPAILFGGDVSSYVVWCVARDGAVENLGELVVDTSDASGSGVFQTGRKSFGLVVTAEPYDLVGAPGDLVIATSGAADPEKAPSATFAFAGFRSEGVRVDTNTLAGLTYREKKPVALVQAERAMALADGTGAAALDPVAMEEAKRALAQAENSTRAGGSATAVRDYARRTVALAAEAMRRFARTREAEEAARKKAEMDAVSARAATGEMTIEKLREAEARLESDKAELEKSEARLEAEKAGLEAEKARLLADRGALQKERDELSGRLRASMSAIMETRESARGAVMSLPGISFETGRAALRPPARLTLAKLAGIAQVFPNINMRIEGYTDSTGKPEANRKLSEARARSVYDFLREQGVADTRLAFQGLGAANPVADNATKEGRAKNRRVEIVAAPGEIQPVSAN